MLSDGAVQKRIGEHLRSVRLKQNITQQELAIQAGLSLSSVKKIEKGETGTFDSWLRVLRTLGKLEVLQTRVEEVQLSPGEYYELMHSTSQKKRMRASGKTKKTKE